MPERPRCECTWKYHQGKPCPNEAHDHGDVRTSPELCMSCLHVCCGEEEDEMEAGDATTPTAGS